MSKNKSSLSGVSVGIGFLLTGLMIAFVYPALLPLNAFVASCLILIGIVGIFIELEKEIGNKNLGIDNSGIGIFLIVVSMWLISLAESAIPWQWLIYTANAVFAFILLLGMIATFDGVYKILKSIFKNGVNVEAVAKTLGIIVALASSSLALMKQAGVL